MCVEIQFDDEAPITSSDELQHKFRRIVWGDHAISFRDQCLCNVDVEATLSGLEVEFKRDDFGDYLITKK